MRDAADVSDHLDDDLQGLIPTYERKGGYWLYDDLENGGDGDVL